MFGYIRVFSITSLFAVALIAALIGVYFRSQASTDIRLIAEASNTAQAEGFAFGVWRHQRLQVLPALARPQEPNAQAALAQFKAYAQQYAASSKLQRFAVYDATGAMIFATDGYAGTPKPEVVNTIKELQAKSQNVNSDKRAAGSAVDIVSFVPLYNTQGIEALVETATPVTREWGRMIIMQWVVSGSLITVCAIILWILLLTSKKAEEIIEQQHEANVSLEASAAAARAETEQKSLFLANISHELRTPLNAIIGFSDILRLDPKTAELGERNATYLHDIHQAGVHLLSLINDILDFSKAEAGKLELEISEVNASKLVNNCLRLVSPRAEAAGVILDDATPKESLVLTTDNKKLKQVLLNLLSNAVKFTPSGGSVRVFAWRDLANDCVGFEIKDTGIGIAAKDISKAMMPFGQVDNTLSRKYEGTGLGLPLTKKFVELMGGTFNIESEVGAGTRVTFLLPTTFVAHGNAPVKMVG